MRMNLPVMDEEHVLAEDALIVTKTDLKGLITYVNQDFIDACGFSREELIGAPHNLVRHPDVPAAAFADLWQTLKAGRPWSGIVKNRRKDGRYYWVVANVAPITEGGRVTGYVSSRTKPSREQIAAATALYTAIREGKDKNLRLHDGQVEVRGVRGLPDWIRRHWSLRRKFGVLALLLILPLLAMSWHWYAGIGSELAAVDADRQGLAEHRQLRTLLETIQNERLALTQGATWSSAAENPPSSAPPGLLPRWQDARARRASGSAAEAVTAYTRLTRETVSLMAATARQSGLVLESTKTGHHLTRLVAEELPGLTGVLGEARAWGNLLSTRQASGSRELRRELLAQSGAARAHWQEIDQTVALLGEADPALAERLGGSATAFSQLTQRFLTLFDFRLLAPDVAAMTLEQYSREASGAIAASYAFYDTLASELDTAFAARAASLQHERQAVGGAILVLLVAGFGLGTALVLGLIRALRAAAGHLKRLAEGDYHAAIDSGRQDEIGTMLDALRGMQIRAGFDLAQTRRNAIAAARVATGLARVSTRVMLTDAQGKIIFVNDSLLEHFGRHTEDIRRDIPGFSAEGLMHSDIDRFHKNPAHQRHLLAGLRAPHRANIELGGRSFELTVTPVRAKDGTALGYAAEWLDRTEELAVEREVAAMLTAAAQGDFSVRLALQDKQGFFRELAQSVNRLLELSQSGLAEI
ncbi:partial Aerotaxis receptor, partial [Burkholderiales bacterium]